MIKLNEYFNGNIKSLGARIEGQEFTAGIVLPGSYTLPTEKNEHLTVTIGQLEVRLPNSDWQKVKKGETIIVPAKTEFQLKTDKTSSYVCLYK